MESEKVKLNLASGAFPLPGYINIDNKSQYEGNFKVDMEADVLTLEWEKESVDEILLNHFLMYIAPEQVAPMINKWFGWLKSGGKLIIETGNIRKIAQRIVDTSDPLVINGQDGLMQVFGWNTTVGHKWAWCPETLLPILVDAGFADIAMGNGVFHDHSERDFMAVATKK